MLFDSVLLPKEIKNNLFYFVICLIFIFLFFDPIPGGDSVNYYALTSSIFHDLDVDLTNQYKIFFPDKSLSEVVDYAVENPEIVKYNSSKEILYSDHPPGFSLAVLPFYLALDLLSNLSFLHYNDSFFLSLRGDILLHLLAPSLTSLFFFFIAFVFCIRIFTFYKLKNPGLWFSLGFFATNLLHYMSVDSAYPQVLELALFSVFLYYFLVKKKDLVQGLSLGFLVLVKPYFLGIAFLVFLYKLWKKESLLPFILPVLFFLGAWGFYNNVIYDSFLETGFNSSLSSGFSLFLIPFRFFSILFSPTNGFLFFTPFVLLGFFGLLFFFIQDLQKRKITEKSFFFLFFLGYLLFFSSMPFWAESGSFAHKTFCFFMPLLVIGAYQFYKGIKLSNLSLKLPIWVFYLLAIFTFIVWILFLNQNYLSEFFLLLQNFSSFCPLQELSFVRFLNLF